MTLPATVERQLGHPAQVSCVPSEMAAGCRWSAAIGFGCLCICESLFKIAGLLKTEKVSEFSRRLTCAFMLSFDSRN